jgi:hypothetical protein
MKFKLGSLLPLRRSSLANFCGPVMVTCLLLICSFVPALAQTKHKPAKPAPHTPQIKADMLTLRYKPQAGTLLYNIHTQIDQLVHSNANDYRGVLRSEAQLAFHNLSIDYKNGMWSFEEYFTKFDITGHDLLGDSVSLNESWAVDRITDLTYDMQGEEVGKVIRDTLRLMNAEAQTNAYFFEPPRMLIPLPEHPITYGDAWTDHRTDTVPVRDTINTGITSGEYIYDVSRTYHLARLLDTDNRYFAIIAATDTGVFHGFQTNSETKVTSQVSGPINGADTTVLDLFSGCVIKRSLEMNIPASVTVSSAPPFVDKLAVYSIVTLDESNATKLKNN